jgi:hypothetical protein
MDKKKCLQLLLYSLCLSASLAIDIFNPTLKGLFCMDLLDRVTPKADNSTAHVGLNIGLNPILDRLEEKYLPDRDWGDFPENLQRDLG